MTLTSKKASDVGVQYEAHPRAGDANHQSIQRIVLAALRSEPIREPEKLLLVDRAQHRRRRPGDNIVFEGNDRQRALLRLPSGFGMNRRRAGCARYAPR